MDSVLLPSVIASTPSASPTVLIFNKELNPVAGFPCQKDMATRGREAVASLVPK